LLRPADKKNSLLVAGHNKAKLCQRATLFAAAARFAKLNYLANMYARVLNGLRQYILVDQIISIDFGLDEII